LRQVLASAGAGPFDVLSKRSKVYRARSAEIDAMTDDELLVEMVAEPTLLRRPLVIADNRLVVGFDRTGLQQLAGRQHESE
jgi:arsenate reductase-like glutaredoxin family protein